MTEQLISSLSIVMRMVEVNVEERNEWARISLLYSRSSPCRRRGVWQNRSFQIESDTDSQ